MASIGRRGEDQDAKEPLLTPKESSQGDVKQATKHEDDEDDQDSWSNWVTLGLMFATIVCVAGTVLISAGFELPSSLQNFFDGILGTSSPSGVDGPAAYCSGHGIQISLKSCVCDLGYAGNLCQDVIDIREWKTAFCDVRSLIFSGFSYCALRNALLSFDNVA
ncbi:hypothetical protein M427DRAFT_344030 [Gonapodya prolifera JEL478]|uniref:EGF-like domain-containing protein n=1 Tax=Gonapodya prolifera (strain JEL478) TaxID=1344416 RepID=A0A139AW94_GONPJ|nr:hypothetical protein M427DRAFT_344030 [Gonapodya prolifera JEL478]|eukprot:KXS20745.1 hypothetical protein M427DRAFT_344030 [Gonapodya prolifera JEL478]